MLRNHYNQIGAGCIMATEEGAKPNKYGKKKISGGFRNHYNQIGAGCIMAIEEGRKPNYTIVDPIYKRNVKDFNYTI